MIERSIQTNRNAFFESHEASHSSAVREAPERRLALTEGGRPRRMSLLVHGYMLLDIILPYARERYSSHPVPPRLLSPALWVAG